MAPNAPKPLVRAMFGLLNDGGVGGKDDRRARLAVYSFITWRDITTTDDLSEVDIKGVLKTLEYWKACGEIEYRCRRIAEKIQEVTAT